MGASTVQVAPSGAPDTGVHCAACILLLGWAAPACSLLKVSVQTSLSPHFSQVTQMPPPCQLCGVAKLDAMSWKWEKKCHCQFLNDSSPLSRYTRWPHLQNPVQP